MIMIDLKMTDGDWLSIFTFEFGCEILIFYISVFWALYRNCKGLLVILMPYLMSVF